MVGKDAYWNEDRRFYLKAVIVIYILWAVAFEAVGYFAARLPTHDPTLPLDTRIPLMQDFIWPYFLCYIFPFLPLFCVRDWHRANTGLLAVIFSSLLAFVIYLAYPVAFQRPEIGPGLSGKLLSFQYAADFQPGANKLPSLHVAIAWIVYFICHRQGLSPIAKFILFICAAIITISTLLVKQHIMLDVAAGCLLAVLAWVATKYVYSLLWDGKRGAPDMFLYALKKFIPALAVICAAILALVWFQRGNAGMERIG